MSEWRRSRYEFTEAEKWNLQHALDEREYEKEREARARARNQERHPDISEYDPSRCSEAERNLHSEHDW